METTTTIPSNDKNPLTTLISRPSLCPTCGATFDQRVFNLLGRELIAQRQCDTCSAAESEVAKRRRLEKARHEREARWAQLCDVEYRTTEETGGKTDLGRLDRECPRLGEITAWTPDERCGLVLRGPTGRCKTRAMWRLIRRMWEDGARVCELTAGGFGRQYADACGNFTRTEWFNALVIVEVLFLDDFGKAEWSAGAWGEFFDLVEARLRRGKTLLLTTNETGESLRAKAKDLTTWAPLYRRLKDSCVNLTL